MTADPARQAFTAALDGWFFACPPGSSILAALLCGSLSHDTVWAKSDIDLVLVTIDDSKVKAEGIALYADGVNVHAMLMPRREFRRLVEGSVQNSFMHALLAKGRLLYTHDDTIARLARVCTVGAPTGKSTSARATGRCRALQGHKWLVTRWDLDTPALDPLPRDVARQIEPSARRGADREVLPRA